MMKKKYLFVFILIIPLFFTSCEKKGNIEIYDTGHVVENCTSPFFIQFYLDLSFQPTEINYTWDFGDGTTSNDKEPIHSYSEPGVYNVKLVIENYKTIVEETMIVNVNKDTLDIVADMDYETIFNLIAPAEIQFYNYSKHATSYFWNFGDGLGSDEVEPIHIYESSGTQTVVLYAICEGDTTSATYNLEIKPAPEKVFINNVVIWLPESYLGGEYELEYYYDIHNETPVGLGSIAPSSFPMDWVFDEEIFFFNGDYDRDFLSFEIWDRYDNHSPVYTFQTTMSKLAEEHYPEVMVWDDGNGFAAEVYFSYQ